MFQRPELARIFFWHFPCPMMLTAFMCLGAFFSLRYFVKITLPLEPETNPTERRLWDLRATAALELGFLYAILTMATGIVFSKAQWGALWQWDPRQTSFLIALLIYGAYFALRAAFSEPDQKAAYSAAYMLAATLPLIFLIFVFPRLPQVLAVSFHPTDTIMGGNLKGQYLYVTLTLLALVSVLSGWVYRLRVKAGLLEIDNELEDASGATGAIPVVRPVRVPAED